MTAIVIQIPTMVNPESLDSVECLKAALHEANMGLLEMGQALAQLQCQHADVSRVLGMIIGAHMLGHTVELQTVLTRLANEYCPTKPTAH